ncbi:MULTISPECIES: hypothetical protein [unclassified Leifsonia]|uniref:hypothetical protein n=1 Tax=unclassified Leifsonia TaxID=2663824 RepID=UPI0006F7BEC1|nr:MULTISPECIES: hypothetical protein [unclassified Leifsonia]KQX07800.1 hypothetical protein ASC59_08750 [Leifsonia sp. Root1293]KRA12082.1 hypothetical protein ASD61_08750 [Leifsonia sp. Root60]
MTQDAERDRLVQRVYARSSADEAEQSFVDPETGERVSMRPSVWELMLHDRRVAAARAAAPVETAAPDVVAVAVAKAEAAAPAPAPSPPGGSGRRSGRRMLLIGLAAGVLVGALAVTAVEAVDRAIIAARPPTPAPTAMLETVFNSLAYPTANPGDAVVPGYVRESFRRLAADIVSDDDVQIYAAIRDDGAYCLVSVVSGVRAVSECATAEELAERGLRMEKTATRPSNPELLTLTVEWGRNGMITWHVDEAGYDQDTVPVTP